MAVDTTVDYSTWSPERLMLEYPDQIKGIDLIRCGEWYSNKELEAKINAHRATKIKNPNFFAEFKRAYEIIAIQDGHLPTVWRLEYDKRRCANLAARGKEHLPTVNLMRKNIEKRENKPVVYLPKKPTLSQLNAARPEIKHEPGATETRDYWYKLNDAATRYTEPEIAAAFNMGKSVIHDEMNKAKRFVKRFRELEEIEARGEIIPQTYHQPAVLSEGAIIYAPSVLPELRGTATPLKTSRSTSPGTMLASIRVRRTLYRLRDTLNAHPEVLTWRFLRGIANSLELAPVDVDGDSEEETLDNKTCETAETLATYRTWCDHESPVDVYGPSRTAKCIVWLIETWLDHVQECEDEGLPLHNTFLQGLIGALSNVDEIEREIKEHEEELATLVEEVHMAEANGAGDSMQE